MSVKTLLTLGVAWRLKLISISPRIEVISSIWRYAFPVSVAGVLGVLLNYADKFVLSAYISSAEFAIYAIGCLSIPPLFMLEYSATRVLIPRISLEIDNANQSEAAKLYQETVRQIAWLTIPATCGLVIFAEPIVSLLFTESYAAGAPYLKLFALSYLLLAVPYDAVARAKGDGTWILRNFAIWSGSALVISAALASKFGAMGALGGAILAQLGMRIWGVNYTRKALRASLSELFPLIQLRRYGLVAILLSALATVARPAFDTQIDWFLVSAPIFALLYFFLLYLLPTIKHAPKTKVLFLTQHFEMGGLEVMIAHLVRKLAVLPNFTPIVFAYDEDERAGDKGLSSTLRNEGITVYTHKKGRGFSFLALSKLLSCIVRNQVEVIHSHDLGALMYGALAKILLLGKTRLIHTQHSFVHLSRNKRYRLYESLFSRLADELVVLNPHSRNQYLELGVPLSKLSTIENGISVRERLLLGSELRHKEREALFEKLLGEVATESESQSLRAFVKDRWILSLARYHPVKGQRHILEAWETLSPEIRGKAALIFLGPDVIPGELDVLRKRVETLPDKNRIFLFETTNRPEDWISVADLYLSLSEYEGLPLGPLEAIALGTPVLISEIEGHSHIKSLSDQVPLGNSDRVSEAISSALSALDHESVTLKLLSHAKEVRERYSIDLTCQKYLALYSETKQPLKKELSTTTSVLAPEARAA